MKDDIYRHPSPLVIDGVIDGIASKHRQYNKQNGGLISFAAHERSWSGP
jgi:hypothetical protein